MMATGAVALQFKLLRLFLVALFRCGDALRLFTPGGAFLHVISSLAISHKTTLSSLRRQFQIVSAVNRTQEKPRRSVGAPLSGGAPSCVRDRATYRVEKE